MDNSIQKSKRIFNNFFKNDLYGRFDNDNNIILSRGGWNDDYIAFPKIFRFCIDYTLKKHWVGYSDSLGHKNTMNALVRLVNIEKYIKKYNIKNIALTMGNVVTVGLVFRQLKNKFPEATVLALKPYYPPIMKSINHYYKKIIFVSSLQSEIDLINDLKIKLIEKNVKIILLNNSIGVEGRIFSDFFWKEIVKIVKNKKIYLVIDEGAWFEQLKYCSEINNEYTIRIVSLSKKYGLPGCKIGYMLASENFIKDFYDCASTNYGGPPSVFFLLSEFIYQFEFIYYANIKLKEGLRPLCDQYNISFKKLSFLYKDFIFVSKGNKQRFYVNRGILNNWVNRNSILVDHFYDFGGINVFVKISSKFKAYDIFLSSIIRENVSIMPSVCLGDESDSMFRVTLLEKSKDFKNGLDKLIKIIKQPDKI